MPTAKRQITTLEKISAIDELFKVMLEELWLDDRQLYDYSKKEY